MTQVVDFGQEADAVDEFVTHPDGYEGVFVVGKEGAKKIERNGQVSGVEINGVVDGANVRDYLPRYQDRDTGEWGFAAFRVSQCQTAFGLRKHGDTVNPSALLKITEGKKAKVRLKINAYGKCKSCHKASADMADDQTCRCGGLVERRERNEVDRWLEPDAEIGQPNNKAAAMRQPAASGDSGAWG